MLQCFIRVNLIVAVRSGQSQAEQSRTRILPTEFNCAPTIVTRSVPHVAYTRYRPV